MRDPSAPSYHIALHDQAKCWILFDYEVIGC
jgi:hypothetical protein